MNFEFSADQMQLKDIARKFLEKEGAVERARNVLEGEESFDENLWQQIIEMGFNNISTFQAKSKYVFHQGFNVKDGNIVFLTANADGYLKVNHILISLIPNPNFLSILMINLIHALFEDTLLMLLVGGHYSGVIFARIFFGLVISLLMLKCYQKYSKFFEKSSLVKPISFMKLHCVSMY